jgi:hypothetical protein
MSVTDDSPLPAEAIAPPPSTLWKEAPYIVVLVLAVLGVGYSNATRQPLVEYWELMAVVTGVLCVITKWNSVDDRNGRFRLIGTQILHWAAVLVMMNIMVLFQVQSMMPMQAVSLVLLGLLALGTFLAGVGFLSLPICFLGAAMALTVPAIAWLTQSFLFLLLAAVLLAGVAIAVWPSRKRRRQTA